MASGKVDALTIQNGKVSFTGSGYGHGWKTKEIQFETPYSEVPLVSVGGASGQGQKVLPVIYEVTKTAITLALWDSDATVHVWWFAIGKT